MIISFLKKNIKTISITFIMGILLFYIQPILDYIGNKVVDLFISLSVSFSDAYYTNVAIDNPDLIEDFNSYMLSLGFFFFMYLLIRYINKKKKDLRSGVSETLSKIQSTRERYNENKKELNKSTDELLVELEDLEKSAKQFEISVYKRDNLHIIASIMATFLVVFMFSNYSWNKSISTDNLKFRNKQIVLLPYVGHEKIDLLKSSWTQMKSKEDYLSIKNEVETLEIQFLKNKTLKNKNNN